MAQFFQIHPENPQQRLVKRAADILQCGGVLVYPTDSSYALGCLMGDKLALERICAIRQLNKHHNFTLMCRDLSEVASYAKLNNQGYRLLKQYLPGSFTFIMDATSETPKRLKHPKRKTIGIRVPSNAILQALLTEINQPLMTTTLILPNETVPLTDPYDIRQLLEHQVDLVIDGGFCGMEVTTVLDMTGDNYEIVRQGCGQLIV